MQGSYDGTFSLTPEACRNTIDREGVILMYQLYWEDFPGFCGKEGLENYGAGKGLALDRVGLAS